MKSQNLLRLAVGILLAVLTTGVAFAQEKKNIRMVFVSLAWNSEIPFRAALARGFFKQQGLSIEPILIRGLTGDPEIIGAAWELFAPGLTSDLSIVTSGLQQMLDEDIRTGLVDSKFTLDRVVNDRVLKLAQQELRAEGRLKP